MSNRTTLKSLFSTGQRVDQSDTYDLIDSQLNLSDENVLKQVNFTLVSNNITNNTATPYVQDLSLGNIFYYDITSGTGNFTFNYSNPIVGVYYFIFRRAANLAIRNITWASSKYASAFGTLPVLTAPTSTVDGKDLIMGFYDGSRMVLVQQANILNN